MKAFIRMLISMSVRLSSAEQFTYGILPNYMPNLRGLVYGVGSASLSPRTLQLSTFVVSLILFAMACWCGRHLQRTDAFLLGITASGLVSYHLLIHDLTIMIVPLFLVLDHCLFSEGKVRISSELRPSFSLPPFSWRSPQHTFILLRFRFPFLLYC